MVKGLADDGYSQRGSWSIKISSATDGLQELSRLCPKQWAGLWRCVLVYPLASDSEYKALLPCRAEDACSTNDVAFSASLAMRVSIL